MKSIIFLPPEIRELICSFLSGTDYCTALCVCTSWYNEFIQHLYKNLTIKGEQQLEQVCRSLLHHAPVYLGNSVRTINLRIESINNRHLSQLGAWCPNVESLYLRWSIWHESELQETQKQPQIRLGDIIDGADDTSGADSIVNTEDAKRKEKYPAIMASFIGPFMNLSRLTLDVSFGKQKIKLPKFIPFLPRLTSLTMANGTHLSLEYIEYIHNMCPSLQHLSLQGTFIGSIPNMIIPTENMAEQSSSSPTPLNIKPATTLLNVEMEFVIESYEKYLDWLSYFALKYPNMTSFEFRQYGMIALPTDPSTLIGPEQQNNDNPVYNSVFTRLADGCQQLSCVRLYNIHIHPGFFNKMGSALDHVSIHLPASPTMPYLSSLFHHRGLQQHLTSLDLSFPMKNSTGQHLSSDQIVSVIGRLYQLKSLTLRWGNELPCLHLDVLLQHFTRLTHLTLVGLKLGLLERSDTTGSSPETTTIQESDSIILSPTPTPYQNANEKTHQQHHPLQSLTLRGVTLMDPQDLFLWIDNHVALSNLTFAQSCRSISSLDNKPIPCNIWLPDTRLDTFAISERRHQHNPTRLYMLHQTTANQQRDDYRPRFTDLAAQDGGKHGWYFLKSYDHESVSSSRLVALDPDRHFDWSVPYHDIKNSCPWYADFCDTADDVHKKQALDKNVVDDIAGIEYMNIVCRSIRCLRINDQRLSFV